MEPWTGWQGIPNKLTWYRQIIKKGLTNGVRVCQPGDARRGGALSTDPKTVVLRGAGPNIKISNKGKSKISILSKEKSKTIQLKDNTNIKFAS